MCCRLLVCFLSYFKWPLLAVPVTFLYRFGLERRLRADLHKVGVAGEEILDPSNTAAVQKNRQSIASEKYFTLQFTLSVPTYIAPNVPQREL